MKSVCPGDFPAVQWLRFYASSVAGLIPGQGTKTSQITQHDIYMSVRVCAQGTGAKQVFNTRVKERMMT